MLYFIVGLIFYVIIIVFINIYYVSGPGFINLHKLSRSILPVIPTLIPIYREHRVSDVTQLIRDRNRI